MLLMKEGKKNVQSVPFLGAHRSSFIALGVVSRPSCAANQPVVLSHFLPSSVTLKVLQTLIHFP